MTGGTPAVFLDRDGTLIEDANFIADPALVRLVPGAAQAVARLNAAGYLAIVVTNQSGIAQGLVSPAAYARVAVTVATRFAALGARLDAQYHCPHHPDVTGPCECRKPGLLLYMQAAEALHVDLARSWCVGDRLRDLLPSRRFGGRAIHVRTGQTVDDDAVLAEGFPSVPSLAEAVELILGG